jgi:FAD:protein FMN transferase
VWSLKGNVTRLGLLSLIFIFLSSFKAVEPLKRFQLSGYAQGTTWQLNYYAADSIIQKKSIDSILKEIDLSMSLYEPTSLINRFNKSEHGVLIDAHFKAVINRSIAIYNETGGVFDVTVKPLVQAWGFGVKNSSQPPSSHRIQQILACTGTNKLEISGDSLLKTSPCIEVDLNGIAQGYTVDLIADFLEKNNIANFLVELGGEMRIKGRKAGNELFSIGIESPQDSAASSMRKIIKVDEGAITTSGNYRRYKSQGSKRISHLIDPKTGYPIQNEMISVTVWAKDAITSDGFDNVFMNWGVERSLEYLKKRSDMAAYFIYLDKNRNITDTASAGFKTFFTSNN